MDFNGLYGQDSHEYYRYSRAVLNFFKTGDSPGDYFWPVYYPIFGALFGIVMDNLICLQLISILSLTGSLFFLFRIMIEIFSDDNHLTIYLLITFLLSPFVLRSSLVVMSDMLSVFFITASFYFFIDYIHNKGAKQIVLFSIFSSMAVLTRYAAVVVLLLPAIIIINQIIKNGKSLHLFICAAIAFLLSLPHILIRESNVAGFMDHIWLQDWSLSNFLRSDFVTSEGIQHYRFPNILNSFSNIFFPTYLVFGLVLAVLSERNLPINRFWLISVAIVFVYAMFLAGIPYQNHRYLLLSYPFVVITIFPGFERFVKLLDKRKNLYNIAVCSMLAIQLFYCVYFFKPVYERNILEKKIAEFVKNDTHKNVYAFDIDVSFMSYDVNKNVVNMWKEKISYFDIKSIVIFNEGKFKEQWANLNPMLNWNELKTNYTLMELKDFGSGWKAFEIRSARR